MTTRRLRVLATAVLPWVASASLLAAPIGRPTPPPCSAEGACVPHRPTWGYTKTQWRLWPGTTLDSDGPQSEPAIGSRDVPPTDPPKPANEDQLAPPTVEALEETKPEPRGTDEEGPGFELPSDDEFEGTERPTAPPAAPANGGLPDFMREQPSEVPAGQPPADGAAPRDSAAPFGQPPAGLFPDSSRVPAGGPSFGGDAPPALPLGLRKSDRLNQPKRLPTPRAILPASATAPVQSTQSQVSLIPVETKPSSVVQRAGGDTPPAMPRGLFNR